MYLTQQHVKATTPLIARGKRCKSVHHHTWRERKRDRASIKNSRCLSLGSSDVAFFKQFRVPLFPRYCNSFVQRMPRHYKRTIWPYPSGARSIPKYCKSLVMFHLKIFSSSQLKRDKYFCLKSAKKIQFMILASRI